MAIIHVTGNPRAGKTSYVVARVLTEHMKFNNVRYKSLKGYIKSLYTKYGLVRTLPPQRHVVFSNIDIHRRFPTMNSYDLSGFEFGKPNVYCPWTRPLVPYGVYVFDESQKFFDSKSENKNLPFFVSEAVEQAGHIMLELIFITQRPVRLNTDIRSICHERIHIEKSVHTYKFGKKTFKSSDLIAGGRIVKTEFFGREFDTIGDHEAYVKESNKEAKSLGRKFKYVFEGDIRKHYNPRQFENEMIDAEHDFEYERNPDKPLPADWSKLKEIEAERKKKEREDGKKSSKVA